MNLSQVEYLIAVAEHGGLRPAARALGISAPALAKSLKSLEGEHGVLLLHRSVRGLQFTEYGQVALRRARSIQSDVVRFRDDIAQMRGSKTGSVTVGVSPISSALVLPAAIDGLLKLYPEVRVRVVDTIFPASLESLSDGELDFVVGPMPNTVADKTTSAFDASALFYSEIGVLARMDHPLRHARSVKELRKAKWVIIGSPTGPSALMEAMFRDSGIDLPQIAVMCDSLSALQPLLQTTDLLTLLPLRLASRGGPMEGNTVRIALPKPKSLRISLITLRDKPLTPAALALASQVRMEAQKLITRQGK